MKTMSTRAWEIQSRTEIKLFEHVISYMNRSPSALWNTCVVMLWNLTKKIGG